MSTDERIQILFNSPALHALRREQLLKLCKAHSIKASGKKDDLIQRLQEHARSLQSPSNSSNTPVGSDDVAMGDREDDGRDVTMEDLQEIVYINRGGGGTMSSLMTSRSIGAAGEFGTASSSNKCQSVLTYIIAREGYPRPWETCRKMNNRRSLY